MNALTVPEAEYRILKAHEQRCAIFGEGSLAEAVAASLRSRKIAAAIVGGNQIRVSRFEDDLEVTEVSALPVDFGSEAVLETVDESLGGLTMMVNLFMPSPETPSSACMLYADALQKRCNSVAEKIAATTRCGAIVNHCALPVMYCGTALEESMSSVRGAITGVIRSIARKYGRDGVRCTGVQTGLIDIPEVHQWASEQVKEVPVPIKRWGTSADVAKMITFLACDASYITGQTVILDGGLTAGISGV